MDLSKGKLYKWLFIAYSVIVSSIMIISSIIVPKISLSIIAAVISLTAMIFTYFNFQFNLLKSKSKNTSIILVNIEKRDITLVDAINEMIKNLEGNGYSIDNVQLMQDNRKEAYITYYK